jgi:hypothetical protein
MDNAVETVARGGSSRIPEVPRLSRLAHLQSLRPYGQEFGKPIPYRADRHIIRELGSYHEYRHAFADDGLSGSRRGALQCSEERLILPTGRILLQVPITIDNLGHLERLVTMSPGDPFFWKTSKSDDLFSFSTKWHQGKMMNGSSYENLFDDLSSRLVIARVMIETGFALVDQLLPTLTTDGKVRARQFMHMYNPAQPPLVYLVVTEAEGRDVCE